MRNSYLSTKRKKEPAHVSLDSLIEKGKEPSSQIEEERFSPEELKSIMNLVYSLPGKYREVLILRYVKEITYKKIAEILELPVSAVTTRLTHARKLLVSKSKAGGII
jgi:RNA polymerase sigma-70 factor, ECF subfamily